MSTREDAIDWLVKKHCLTEPNATRLVDAVEEIDSLTSVTEWLEDIAYEGLLDDLGDVDATPMLTDLLRRFGLRM